MCEILRLISLLSEQARRDGFKKKKKYSWKTEIAATEILDL